MFHSDSDAARFRQKSEKNIRAAKEGLEKRDKVSFFLASDVIQEFGNDNVLDSVTDPQDFSFSFTSDGEPMLNM